MEGGVNSTSRSFASRRSLKNLLVSTQRITVVPLWREIARLIEGQEKNGTYGEEGQGSSPLKRRKKRSVFSE